MTVEQLREIRRLQGLRVANASRGRRAHELELYMAVDDAVRIAEWKREAFGPTVPMFEVRP